MPYHLASQAIPPEFAAIADICTATDVLIGGRSVLGIADARDLHTGLKVGRDYVTWIKSRIAKFGFQEGVDFDVTLLPNLGEKGPGRPIAVYRLTLDMAKELAMVENNETGRLARRYFIWVESVARGELLPDRPFDFMSPEGMNARCNVVNTARRVFGAAGGTWAWDQVMPASPSRRIRPAWAQHEMDLRDPPPATLVAITVQAA